ncbi:DASH family cryptochrome [uncultured Polaribacter sp.]|uniref:DASH family cryptochrome n=1 Tax=uncultured Polaribacter sp. TaxID=174711 RepID=UPI002606398D|nr:DASH family cryptochrome [uncultured Polaribacter sp.]
MQQKQNNTALVWFRNNLRVNDNNSLTKATENHDNVIAVFFFDPKFFNKDRFGFRKTEKFRAQFLLESIKNLEENLAKLNITLLTYFESPEERISQLCSEFSINTIYTQKEWTPEELLSNRGIQKSLVESLKIIEDFDQFLYHPEHVTSNFSKIPDVFTVFRKKIEKYVSVLPEVKPTLMPVDNLLSVSTKIPTIEDLGYSTFKTSPKTAFPFKGGEDAALKRLHYYFFETKKVSFYKKTRNGLVGIDYSTKFSSWLANGSISPKTIYWNLKRFEEQHGKNQSTYWVIFELIWRDYFKYISLKHDAKIFKIGGILDRDYEWKNNQNTIQKWIDGETHDSFVNANMIELKETGWMSNRGRQNVASYFAKELLQDWRIGAAYFESMLIDYDVHSNYGNWMYVAGVGNDPRDRKFNVKLQADRYDNNHSFRNLWLQKTLF